MKLYFQLLDRDVCILYFSYARTDEIYIVYRNGPQPRAFKSFKPIHFKTSRLPSVENRTEFALRDKCFRAF